MKMTERKFDIITTLSGEFLVTNWLAREQKMLRDVGFSVFCRFSSKPTSLASAAASDFQAFPRS